MPSEHRVRRALLSVSDKTGLAEFARALSSAGVELLSTGGSARVLREAGLEVRDVADVTGIAEMMAGRVKTLHPKIHGGILARRDKDEHELEKHGIEPIDLVVVNLYPFEATISRDGVSEAEAVEQIDIGGPTLLRAAAKNFDAVTVVVDPADYAGVAESITAKGDIGHGERRRLAAKAFARTAAYDAAIESWFGKDDDRFPKLYAPRFTRVSELRYGENPHQGAALYRTLQASAGSVVNARQHQGKALSFNNLADTEAALHAVAGFEAPTCVIVKHLNPCGIASAPDLETAYRQALAGDSTSAFGGIIAFNRALDEATARAIVDQQFVEVIVAPEVGAGALDVTASKPNVRVLSCGDLARREEGLEIRHIAGGLLMQDADPVRPLPGDAEVATKRAPTDAERAALDFAWRSVQAVRSNAIVLATDTATIGIGAGQMSRVLAVRIAGMKAQEGGHSIAGAVLASDAFFPFRDNIDEAARMGVRAIVQPGGSRRDAEVVAAADEHGMTMLFTHERHFRH
ncbi:MAG: bifunctional phosphoribosylaminoimidazolecarboxamide formyltransferase/IMP cyclohydrolase [Gammaproteobacteria bacterium]